MPLFNLLRRAGFSLGSHRGTKKPRPVVESSVIIVFGAGKNGSATLYGSFHRSKTQYPRLVMEGSEAQRNNVFHVHHAESLHRLMRIFSGQPLKLVYPVRQNIERQIASAFVQYVSKLSQREDHLGLDPQQSGCENLPETVLADALDRYIEVRDFTRALAAWHREAHALVDPGTEPLIDARVCGAQPLELLLLTTERINQSVEASRISQRLASSRSDRPTRRPSNSIEC